MPRLDADDMEIRQIAGSVFTFTGTRIDHLTATEYTLVTIAVDVTGSVERFKDLLDEMLITSINACKQLPRSDNILVRVLFFSSKYPQGVYEVHGFKLLADIEPNDYPDIRPGGMTPLCDVCFSAMGATNTYAEHLTSRVNAILFVITDGGDNQSTATMTMVKHQFEKAVTYKKLESVVSVLVGINAAELQPELIKFQKEAGMTRYNDAGTATPASLAKLAGFISQSVSSQSQALRQAL